MEKLSLFITFLLLVLGFLPLFRRFHKFLRFKRQIDKIPGPKCYPLVGTAWKFIGKSAPEIFRIASECRLTYPGGVYRFWHGLMPEIKISKCEYAELILRSSRIIEKSQVYDYIKAWLGEGLLTSTGPKWFKHRKIITPTFHFSVLENFCTVFGENCKTLIEELSKVSDTGKEINIYPFVTNVALDIICETAMGIKVGAQQQKSKDYTDAVHNFSQCVMAKILNPLMQIPFIYERSELANKTKKTLRTLHEFSTNVIRERKIARTLKSENKILENDFGTKKRTAFLDMLLDANENENFLTDTDIREEVDTFMFEGHDTTTVGISWALLMIALHPEVQEKLFEEIQDVLGDDKSKIATMQELNQMNFLERVIKESLRLYPSVAVVSRQLREDLQLGPYLIPRDCMVTVQIFMLHRDERFFPDPEKFDPDRFLPENLENRHPYCFVPFSAGMRNCIGQKYAVLEEKAVLAAIVSNFKLKSLRTQEDVRGTNELVLRPHGGIHLILEKRNK